MLLPDGARRAMRRSKRRRNPSPAVLLADRARLAGLCASYALRERDPRHALLWAVEGLATSGREELLDLEQVLLVAEDWR